MKYQALVDSGKTYCKITKSTPDIASLCIESFYKQYKTSSVVKGSQLSFVEKENVLPAIPYGDTYTEFNFTNSNANFIFKDDDIICTGNGLNEFTASVMTALQIHPKQTLLQKGCFR